MEESLASFKVAILEIRDSLVEIRNLLREQKEAQEKAMGESKASLGKMMDGLPANLRAMVDPLMKKGA